MRLSVDLNADLGEGAGHDEEILDLVSSASIACGLHAGDPVSIIASIRAANERGVAVGAHPSFNDRENFGREEMSLPPGEVFALCAYQLGAFQALAEAGGAAFRHVKPHGALYNLAAKDRELASAIVHAILAVDSSLMLFAPGESALAEMAKSVGLSVVSEVFADRNYLSNGALVPRARADALLHDPSAAAARVRRMLETKMVRTVDDTEIPIAAETVCVHGDSPEAVAFIRALRTELTEAGITIAAPER